MPEGTLLRKATNAMKGMATLQPEMAGGLGLEQSVIDNERSEAYRQLVALAEEEHRARSIIPEQAFAAILSNPKHRELAARALARPNPPVNGFYAFPR